MRPAWSIIFFTSSSGLGLGLAGWIVLGLLDFASKAQLVGIAIFALALIGAGLISSTLHLGHPERAWRALSQWRSSWLSREGVLAIIVVDALLVWFAYAYLVGTPPLWASVIVLVLILATVYATSMIYASLKTVARWHHPLTPLCYVMFAAAGGLLAVLWLMAVIGQPASMAMGQSVMLLMAAAWGVKLAWWRVAANSASGSSIASATGLGGAGGTSEVRSLMPPHTSENYLQHEMGFVVARKHAQKLRVMAILLGGVMPVAIVWFAGDMATAQSQATLALALALGSHIAGVFVERWLFFAEAKHVVTLYYGDAH